MNSSFHWEQRIALVRHNLHAASRGGDFTFFKTLQANGFVEGLNHAATLSTALGDNSDTVISGLDDLKPSIAYMHQDAFRNVYNSLKTCFADAKEGKGESGKCRVYVDTTMQKQMADHAIDKMTSSAIALIKKQPESAQDAATGVWIVGNTIIADCMQICIKHIDMLEHDMNDFIRLEDSWTTVKASVSCAIAALKGIFSLMAVEESNGGHAHNEGRSASSASYGFNGGNVLRRLSSAFTGGSVNPTRQMSSASTASRDSLSAELPTTNYLRHSVSSAEPTSLPPPPPMLANPFQFQFQHTPLSTIPPTPAVREDEINPFDTSMPVPPMPNLPE